MIEVTLKQIAEIYSKLPDPEEWMQKYHYGRAYCVMILDEREISKQMSFANFNPEATITGNEVAFFIDIDSCPYQWKPNKTLIITGEND